MSGLARPGNAERACRRPALNFQTGRGAAIRKRGVPILPAIMISRVSFGLPDRVRGRRDTLMGAGDKVALLVAPPPCGGNYPSLKVALYLALARYRTGLCAVLDRPHLRGGS